jgi:ElaB/YqjD/DUF883 family membrane-anchored ribosome-binding protein
MIEPQTTPPTETPGTDVMQDALQSTKQALAAGQQAIEDISQLQQRVERKMDWRAQVSERPWMAVGIALAGGLLLSAMFGSSRRDRTRY